MTKYKDFGVYLETVGTAISARTCRAIIGEQATIALSAVFSGQIVVGRSTLGSIVDLLGKPHSCTMVSMSYLLEQKPDYAYTFTFDSECHLLTEHGYQRTNPLIQPSQSDSDWQGYLHCLTTAGATTHEVIRWFGKPINRWGWWPIEVWEYSHQRQIQFIHGIASVEF
jgi:hypothetical protein